MIHGGGYMTLSKQTVRPHQTQFLLDNDYLPVSIDCRLYPEIDLIAGPMTEVRDALDWMRSKLPAIARARGVAIDATKIIAIGWSTGGHLAMTTDSMDMRGSGTRSACCDPLLLWSNRPRI